MIMKALRIVLIIIGYLGLLLLLLSLFNLKWTPPEGSENSVAYLFGYILGMIIFLIPSAVCFFFASRIKRRLRRNAEMKLVESLASDEPVLD